MHAEEANDSSGFLLWQVTALWQRRVAEALRPHELTQVQYALLASLLWLSRKGEDVTQSRLAAHAKLDVMDEAHARIDAENQLILRLNDAMSFRKVEEMREMLVEYRKLDPADTDANQAGYTVIVDCIEHPGEVSLAAARQFYDTQRHSPLRRFVRRICFESSN